jgi:ABC-type bacteriocin/lantibiotic exporter with double-glycine peptidase domain
MDNSWSLLNSSMRQGTTPRALAPGTLRRIVTFAKPHRTSLLIFLTLSTVSAVLAVATPVLAGRVVDGIVNHAGAALVVGLAALIALLTVIDSGIGLASRCSPQGSVRGSSWTCAARCSSTCSGCRWRSSLAPAPARWSAG